MKAQTILEQGTCICSRSFTETNKFSVHNQITGNITEAEAGLFLHTGISNLFGLTHPTLMQNIRRQLCSVCNFAATALPYPQ